MLHPTLSLYRHILRHARVFPSIKRAKLIEEIRISFRNNKTETDNDKIRKALAIAEKGLEQLQQYTTLDKSKNNFSISLESVRRMYISVLNN
jgi:hypothetical protein